MTYGAKPPLLNGGVDLDVWFGIIDGHVLIKFGDPDEGMWLALPPDQAKKFALEILDKACEIDAANRSETTP